jgi:hypothetical protein
MGQKLVYQHWLALTGNRVNTKGVPWGKEPANLPQRQLCSANGNQGVGAKKGNHPP